VISFQHSAQILTSLDPYSDFQSQELALRVRARSATSFSQFDIFMMNLYMFGEFVLDLES
jgi:hypothetical protein